MKLRLLSGVCALTILLTQAAAGAVPSDASIRELLKLTKAEAMVETIFNQVEGMQKQLLQQMSADKSLPDGPTLAEKVRTRTTAVMRAELSWDVLEPLYLQVYRETFTDEEVEAMLVFYRTPLGQSVLSKLPQVMQRSIAGVQQRMEPIVRKLQEVVRQTVDDAKAEAAKKVPEPKKP